jgi:hypothetical protein
VVRHYSLCSFFFSIFVISNVTMFRTEGVGLKRVTNQKGTRGRRGRWSTWKSWNALHLLQGSCGKIQWLKINKVSVIRIAKGDPSLIRGFPNLNQSSFTLKIVLPFLSDPSVTSTRLHDVVNFHSRASDSKTRRRVPDSQCTWETHTGIKRQHNLGFFLEVIK